MEASVLHTVNRIELIPVESNQNDGRQGLFTDYFGCCSLFSLKR